MSNYWILNSLELPEKDGVYEVTLERVDSLIDAPETTIMEFKNGEWDMRLSHLIKDYKVKAWRNR